MNEDPNGSHDRARDVVPGGRFHEEVARPCVGVRDVRASAQKVRFITKVERI